MMSKAEDKAKERSLEKYPLLADDDKEALEALKYIGMEYDHASVYNEIQESKQAYFIEGYHQAEKDLIENKHEKSWRLDERLWSGFKDIEEASYQYIYDASNDWAYDIPTWKDVQDAFKAGADWKENVKLTWEDIEKITDIWDDLHEDETVYIKTGCDTPEFYKEVLKQFKSLKK